MSEMDRILRNEKQRLGAEAAEAKLWNESPFTRYSVVVSTPRGAFARFVSEITPLIPRKMWRKAIVGQSPDGLTRVAWSIGRPEDGERGAGSAVLRRRKQRASRCSLFMVYRYTAIDGGLRLVVLADGRAGYCGELDALRTIAAQTIASHDMPAERLLDMTYASQTWRSE
jgi:hypothetical protein